MKCKIKLSSALVWNAFCWAVLGKIGLLIKMYDFSNESYPIHLSFIVLEKSDIFYGSPYLPLPISL